MRRLPTRLLLTIWLIVLACNAAGAQCAAETRQQFTTDAAHMWAQLRQAPRQALQPRNLKWELPIMAATGVLISSVDQHASAHLRSQSVADASSTASNALLGTEIGATALGFGAGCVGEHPHLREATWRALEAGGYGIAIDMALKAMFNRQYPYTPGTQGEFWDGGKSFPSGHSAFSWALASALAHEYPHRRWVQLAAYGAATATSLLRFPAKKHFPSDILVGGTLGYVVGSGLTTAR